MSTIPKQMQTTLDHIVKTALARPSLSEVSKEELLMLTQEFPYASVLQFLYTKRLQESGDPRFGNSVTRTALFFNNPHWLHQQLRATGPDEKIRKMERAISGDDENQTSSPFFNYSAETAEYEEDTEVTLSASEAALIASITEAPDGSILKQADTVQIETRENESADSSDLSFLEPDEFDQEQTEVFEEELSENTTLEETEHDTGLYIEESHQPSAAGDFVSDSDVEAGTELGGSETSAPIELMEASEEKSGDDTPVETLEPERDSAGTSLITVIAPEESAFNSSVHRINLTSETDNDDDVAAEEISEETSPEDLQPVLQPGSSEDMMPQPEEEPESDNDDDAAIISAPERQEEDESLTLIDGSEDSDIIEPTGLENMGFLPEDLLEDAGVDPLASKQDVELAPTDSSPMDSMGEQVPNDSTALLDDDHPDATDPRDTDDFDKQISDIQPGDLIKMAGLDQHHETELSFEPLHLTDYFASVGVSLPSEEQVDVVGRPSMSFTGWIRSMKRIHPEKTVIHFMPSESDHIRAEAEMSNEQEDVLTETMAGIYALQGLTHKAIDIYEKLSLLNPEKSAIFAAKISELKGRSS